jgi:chemotaxis protein histidine kinase CheA
LIAFAAKAGSTASDGNSRNSPFAIALVEYLPRPGLDIRRAFGFVRDDVLKNTGNKQEPYVYGSLGGNDVPLVPVKPVATGPQADPQAAVRRDYELALQAGDRDAWEAFLRAYPEGFYADLAKVQLKKITAEEVRATASDKARQAEQEKTRLAAEGARQAEQTKAAAAAKAAENARIAAEKAKQVEQEKTAAAERTRLAEQEKVRLAAEKAKQTEQEKAAAAEQARIAAEKATEEKKQQLAAVPPSADKPQQAAVDLPRSLQAELRRVGCNTGPADGNWNAASQKALELFNKHAGMKLDVKTASTDALDAVKGKAGRICPLICETGFRANGDRCVKITCRAGYRLNDDNECEKVSEKKPVATRDDTTKRDGERKKVESAPTKPQASGQMICGQGGCRPVGKGCRLVTTHAAQTTVPNGTGAASIEVCN